MVYMDFLDYFSQIFALKIIYFYVVESLFDGIYGIMVENSLWIWLNIVSDIFSWTSAVFFCKAHVTH